MKSVLLLCGLGFLCVANALPTIAPAGIDCGNGLSCAFGQTCMSNTTGAGRVVREKRAESPFRFVSRLMSLCSMLAPLSPTQCAASTRAYPAPPPTPAPTITNAWPLTEAASLQLSMLTRFTLRSSVTLVSSDRAPCCCVVFVLVPGLSFVAFECPAI
jgi:hypothetical protein